MKKLRNFVLTISMFSILLYGCKKESNTDSVTLVAPIIKTATPKQQFEKLWQITSFQRAIDTSLFSIELTLNNYVLYFSDTTTMQGSYTRTNDSTLNLINYGVLTINSISNSNFGFTLITLNDTLTYTSTIAPQIASSTNTIALCNTWRIVKETLNDTTVTYTYDQSNDWFATFSQYGTYLVKNSFSDGSETYFVNTWNWTDVNENAYCYGNWGGNNMTSCNGLSTSSISFSQQNSHCTMTMIVATDIIVYELEVQ